MAALLHPFATISRLSDLALEGLLGKAKRASTAAEIADPVAAGHGDREGGRSVHRPRLAALQHPGASAPFLPRRTSATAIALVCTCRAGSWRASLRAWSWITGWLRRLKSLTAQLCSPIREWTSVTCCCQARLVCLRAARSCVRMWPRSGICSAALALCSTRCDGRSAPPDGGAASVGVDGQQFFRAGHDDAASGDCRVPAPGSKSLRPDPGTVLLIKSHPRDRTGKRELLEQHLRGLFSEVLSADSVGSAYLPIEAVLLDLMPIVASLQSLTVSTACLATHFVVGSKTHIGFGDELVTKYVAADRRDERCRHESELRRLCAV